MAYPAPDADGFQRIHLKATHTDVCFGRPWEVRKIISGRGFWCRDAIMIEINLPATCPKSVVPALADGEDPVTASSCGTKSPAIPVFHSTQGMGSLGSVSGASNRWPFAICHKCASATKHVIIISLSTSALAANLGALACNKNTMQGPLLLPVSCIGSQLPALRRWNLSAFQRRFSKRQRTHNIKGLFALPIRPGRMQCQGEVLHFV